MVAKLSSVRIMDEASFDTAVPVIPIAIPISAFFKAGASFTPSPVIATIWPFFCHKSTIRILCSGDTRAYTEIFGSNSDSSSSEILSSSVPIMTKSPSLKMPICFAMAEAVTLWSPVIIIGLIPARIQFWTAWADSSLGGSIIQISPTKVYPCSSCKSIFSSSSCFWAKANTRRPFSDILWFSFWILNLSSSVIGRTTPSSNISVTRSSNTSTAPFVTIYNVSSMRWSVLINLRSESNGISAKRGYCSSLS